MLSKRQAKKQVRKYDTATKQEHIFFWENVDTTYKRMCSDGEWFYNIIKYKPRVHWRNLCKARTLHLTAVQNYIFR